MDLLWHLSAPEPCGPRRVVVILGPVQGPLRRQVSGRRIFPGTRKAMEPVKGECEAWSLLQCRQ